MNEQHILIMIAMESEAAPFLKETGIEKVDIDHPWAPSIFIAVFTKA